MKICWDMLEGVRLTKGGNFRKGTVTYIYKESCIKCDEPYLSIKRRQGESCGQSCANKGRVFPVETIEKMSKSKLCSLNFNYKGGVEALGLTSYDGYKDTLGLYEEIRKQSNTEILEVKCAYCGQWYVPTHTSVRNRLVAINSLDKGECRLYCSENCKQACPIYGMHKYPKGFKHTTSREVSTYLRKMVLERDSWTCQICGKTSKEAQLHVHHMDPVAQNPMFQNDINSCITLCKGCHKMVHSRKGCRYIDLVCKKVG